MPFLGSEALAAGKLNRYQLTTRYELLHRDVYFPSGTVLTPADRAVAAWLWSGRQSVVAGLSAAALHGSKWIEQELPAELVHSSRHKASGIILHSDRLGVDEICSVRGIRVTTPARTAFDLGRWRELTDAVVRVDALLQACELKIADIYPFLQRHKGIRGIVQLRKVLDLADQGAESPQETRTRLLLTDAGMRPSHTQIVVFDGREYVGRIDMGWAEWKVGVQYDGIQHWTDPRQRTKDIEQNARYLDLDWRIVRVGADLLRYRQRVIVDRTRQALQAAGAPY